jgi:hypothetical protein
MPCTAISPNNERFQPPKPSNAIGIGMGARAHRRDATSVFRICRALRHDWFSKIRQVVVPWTSKRPLLSVTRPSAVPTRRPRLITTPSALIAPVCGVIGRTNEILNSRVVEPTPLSSVD